MLLTPPPDPNEGRRISVLKISSVLFDEWLFVFGNVVDREHRIRCTRGNARAAVDALRWVDKELSRFFEAGFILLGMDAIGGADIDAEGILDAGIGNYMGHDEYLRNEIWVLVSLENQCRSGGRTGP
jgi:hypothetical protein